MNPQAKSEEGKAELLIETLYDYYLHHIEKISPELIALMERGEARERIVCDYIGAMTDRFAIAQYEEILSLIQIWGSLPLNGRIPIPLRA